jgi:hypothetical protein
MSLDSGRPGYEVAEQSMRADLGSTEEKVTVTCMQHSSHNANTFL